MNDPFSPTQGKTPGRMPATELALMDQANRLNDSRTGRVAIHVHLSALKESNRRDNYIRIATENFSNEAKKFDGDIYVLHNSDIILIAKWVPGPLLNEAVNRLRMLFGEDPVVGTENDGTPQQFATWYKLEENFDDFYKKIQEICKEAENHALRAETEAALILRPQHKPIAPDMLTKFEQTLSRADITSVVRKQTICSIVDNKIIEPLFDETYVSISDLQMVLAPDVNLCSDRWLFQYLTRTLDKRMLSYLTKDGLNAPRPFSINLNVATVLSPEFQKFDQIMSSQFRGRLVVEFNKIDVFSDIGAFIFAREYLKERGYRICLDGLNHQTFRYYDRAKLGFDLVKLFWTPDSIDNITPDLLEPLRNSIVETGQAHTILSRCDSPRAIEIGQKLGILMYQGREIDRKVMEQARQKKPGR